MGLMSSLCDAEDEGELTPRQQAVLSAVRRSKQSLEDADLRQVAAELRSMSDEQVAGFVANVKGILHEMEFVRLENSDGDSVNASMHDATNHPGTDVRFVDEVTGASWESQLKATDSSAYARDWIEQHEGGSILVTSELAQRIGLPSSGIANDQLEMQVEDFVDRAMSSQDPGAVFECVPALGGLAVCSVVWELVGRCRRGEISRGQFASMAVRSIGRKGARFALVGWLLGLPLVGQAVGVALVARALHALGIWWRS